MISISQIKVPLTHKMTKEEEYAAILVQLCKKLNIKKEHIRNLTITKRSIDARKKPLLFYVYSLEFEVINDRNECDLKLQNRLLEKNIVSKSKSIEYKIPECSKKPTNRPVIIGAGPSGLFCAYSLAISGLKPVIIERGKTVKERQADVDLFWSTNKLNPNSNVQFGEGGAGTFSDGKLNTLVKDKFGRNKFVLETFVKFGANEDILYDRPHVGTDILSVVIENLRNEIIRLGGEFHFDTCVEDFIIKDDTLVSLVLSNDTKIDVSETILAIGHSARDTFEKLYERNIPMQAKEFAMGFRVEHPQSWLNEHQYGKQDFELPAVNYKLANTFENNRGVYSFCMCPGGFVVNSSSFASMLTVNGMSYQKRDSKNANSAIVVSVGKGEYNLDEPLSAMKYQMQMEKKAFELCNGAIPQQLLSDFEQNIASTGYGSYDSQTKGSCEFANLRNIYSEEINQTFLAGMKIFDNKIKGFYRPDVILSGIEARTSSPIRIPRNDDFQSDIKGLYPCGEGAGYAGGIMSAAMDGLKVAEKIQERYL